MMYYIALQAKFDNRCSTVWARRQDQWEGNNYSLPFEGCGKQRKFYNVFSDVIFYPHVLQYFWVSQTISALAYLVALTIQCSCYCAQTFEVCGPKLSVREYIFPSICGDLGGWDVHMYVRGGIDGKGDGLRGYISHQHTHNTHKRGRCCTLSPFRHWYLPLPLI